MAEKKNLSQVLQAIKNASPGRVASGIFGSDSSKKSAERIKEKAKDVGSDIAEDFVKDSSKDFLNKKRDRILYGEAAREAYVFQGAYGSGGFKVMAAKLSKDEFESLKEQAPFKGILGNPNTSVGELVSEEPVSKKKSFKEVWRNVLTGGGGVVSEEPVSKKKSCDQLELKKVTESSDINPVEVTGEMKEAEVPQEAGEMKEAEVPQETEKEESLITGLEMAEPVKADVLDNEKPTSP